MRLTCALGLLLAASIWAIAQQGADLEQSQSKILALEHAWNQAEKFKDAKALDAILDSSLVYIDYDGSLITKGDFLGRTTSPRHNPEQSSDESMTAHVYGNSAVVTGIYRVKGVDQGKPYLRRGRFTDTWIYHNSTWVCVASQYTLIRH